MKAILIFFLFCILYFEKAKGQHSLRETSLYWSNKAPSQAIKDGTVVSKQTNKKSGRKHKKGKSVKRNKKQRSKKRKEKRGRKFKRKDKKGALTKRKIRRNKNTKKANKKKRGEKKIKNQRKQTKKRQISRKRKQNRYYKKNIKRTKMEKMNKMRQKLRKGYKIKERKSSQKQKQQRAHSKKRAFYGPNGDNGTDGDPVQEFECDIYGYTRDFSVALTQKNRANRIKKKPKKMEDFARTDFTDAIDALGAATRGGTGCYGSDTTYNNLVSGIIYRHLQFCKNDVPSICDTKKIDGYDNSSKAAAEYCFKSLDRFAFFYRASLFNAPGKKYENVCPSFGNSWNSTVTGNIEDAVADSSEGKKIISPYTPLELWKEHCLPNTLKDLDKALLERFGLCMDPLKLIPGSYGSCMTFLQASLLYVDLCNPFPASFSTITAFYTWINAQLLILENILTNIQFFSPYNTTYRLSEHRNGTQEPKQVGPDLNFNHVIDLLSGTNCSYTEEYEILINCNTSIPEICDAKPFYNDWELLHGSKCSDMMRNFKMDYEIIADNAAAQSGNSQTSKSTPDNLNSSISGYNLPLIGPCIDRFCFNTDICSLDVKQSYKVTELNNEFFISFEFQSTEGPPATNKEQNIITLMDSSENSVLSLSVDHKNATFVICSNTFGTKSNCKSVKNTFISNKWHHVEFTQALVGDNYTYQVKIDGTKKVNIITNQPKAFSNVDVLIHSTNDGTLKGSLRNMFINKRSSKRVNECKVDLRNPASSSVHESDTINYGPEFATDGKNSTLATHFFRSKREDYPWLEVQLSSPTIVSGVTIVNSRYGFGYWFMKAVIRAGPSKIEGAGRADILTTNPICGTYEGPAPVGAIINVECASPVMAEYVSVQLNYTDAILAVDEVKVNPQDSVRNDYTYLKDLIEEIKKNDCLTNEFGVLNKKIEAKISACNNVTVIGSYASCDAARKTAINEYLGFCEKITTPSPFTTTTTAATLVTQGLRRRRQLFYKEKFLKKIYSK